MNKLMSYFDSFQSTFFNQKQRDLFPSRTWLLLVAAAGAGLYYYMSARSVPAKKRHGLPRIAA